MPRAMRQHWRWLLVAVGLAGILAACQPAVISTSPPTPAASPSPAVSPSPIPTQTPTPTATPIPPTPTATPIPPTPTATRTPRPPTEQRVGERQIAPPGGLGNSITDFRQNVSPATPVTGPQSVYQSSYDQSGRTISVQFWLSRRSGALRVDLPEPHKPLNESYGLAEEYLPYDARLLRQPAANLQHYRSQQFANVMPDELLADRAFPGDIFVRFNVRDGRVVSIVLGSGHPSG